MTEMMPTSLLSVKDCSMQFGGLHALRSVCFDLQPEELMAVIGPNGAGKTTLFNLLTGVYVPTEGKIHFAGENICGWPLHVINRKGIARTFQNIRLFPNLTVQENVYAAYYSGLKQSLLTAPFPSAQRLEEDQIIRRKTHDFLSLFHLESKAEETASNLSYGDQRRLEIVRALATGPKLLLLDEPAAGMNASEKNDLAQLIRRIHKEFRLAIILIEHDMKFVMNLVPRILVLDYGTPIAKGTPDEVRRNPKVIEAYLGEMPE